MAHRRYIENQCFPRIVSRKHLEVVLHWLTYFTHCESAQMYSYQNPLDLQSLVNAADNKGKFYGMEMNVGEAKSMTTRKPVPMYNFPIEIEGCVMEQVKRLFI